MPSHTIFDYDDDQPQEFLICYRGARYVLIEPTEGAAIKYRNASIRAAKVNLRKGKPDVANMEGGAEAQVALLSGCVCHAIEDPNAPEHMRDKSGKGWKAKRDRSGNPILVPAKELESWGSKVIKPLFEQAKDLGDLAEKDEDESRADTRTNHDDSDGIDSVVRPETDGNGEWQPPSFDDSPKARGRSITSS
jgi:hypothetical protein